MNFTIEKRDKIDKKIQADMDLIITKILDLLNNHVHSILLCGSFGRGEGSVYVENNQIHIVNDYDFYIVLTAQNRLQYARLYKKFHDPLEKLAQQLASDMGIKQIDLGLKPLSYFSYAKVLRIENYEVRKGHLLLYGDEDPTDKMPNWRAKDLPLFEGTWLFRNRGMGLLIAALYFLCEGGIPAEKKENFVVECTKAQIAMGDSILLLKRQYHHLYHMRLERAAHLDVTGIPYGDEILAHYKEALEQKLRPDFGRYYQRDLTGLWFQISRLLNSFYYYFEKQRLGIQFHDWCGYAALAKPEDSFELKTFIGKTLRSGTSLFSIKQLLNNYKKSRRSYSIALVPLLLFSLGEDRCDREMMSIAGHLLGHPVTGSARHDWLGLAKAVLNEIHPGGEVAKAVKLH